MLTLRPKQAELYARTRESMRQGHKAPLIVAPCGFGKTVLFSYFTKQVISKGKRVLILVHRDELLDQVSETLRNFDVSHSFVAAGRYCSRITLAHVASVFTLVRRLDKQPPPDVIIVDEAHHSCRGSTWAKIFEAYPNAWRIGVTASPIRLSGEPLGDLFDDLILGPSARELIEAGDLCDYRLFGAGKLDLSKVHTVGGDFNKKEVDSTMDKPVITGNAVREYTKHAAGKRAVVFCCSVKHAEHVAEEFRKAGYTAGTIEGTMDTESRRRIVRDFREGRLQVLTSINVISEGFDLPAIEVAIMLRPTQSLGLWIQMSGRALRKHPGKDMAIILDHAGNTERLDFLPCQAGEWSLGGKKKRDKDEDKPPAVRLCAVCYFANEAWRKNCKECGYLFPVDPRVVDEVEGELHELDVEKMRREKLIAQGRCKTEEELVAEGIRRKYKNPYAWARFVLKARKTKNKATW